METPSHIVLIPDGNRRWARMRGKPAGYGHQKGAEAAVKILEAALDLRIPNVTLWGSSANNILKRSPVEVKFLCTIFSKFFTRLAANKKIHENEVRVRVLGRWKELFPASVSRVFEKAVDATKSYDRFNLTFLMAYSGLDEMVDAMRGVADAKKRNPKLKIDPDVIKSHLWTKDLPPVDLVIRTGGEPHWSQGLMMWDVAESRLHFTPTFWPDFSPDEFKKIVSGFGETERRFGA